MPAEKLFHIPPHLVAQDVAGLLLDEGGEILVGVHRLVGFADRFDPAADFIDRAATVEFTEVEMEWTGSDEGGEGKG